MIRQLFSLLSAQQVREFYILQVLVVIMAFTELLGIASIAPFMALVGDISILEKSGFIADLYQASNLNDPLDFVFYIGLLVLIALTFSTLVSMFTTWRLSMYGAKIGADIGSRLYTYYMQEDWQFHASGSSAQLTKQISIEAIRVTNGIVQPLMRMNAKLVLSVIISISIFVYDPIIATIGLAIFILAYLILYSLVRKKLASNSIKLSEVAGDRFRLMNEGFGGIKDVLLLNRSHDFTERFQESSRSFALAQGNNSALAQVPRYFIELMAFGSIITLILVLIKTHQGNLGEVLPILAVYALAAFKLLPALQQIYTSLSEIKGASAAFESIKYDLENSLDHKKPIIKKQLMANLELNEKIVLDDISFSYPGKQKLAVNGVTMTIPANSVVGLVGASGSGKSTLIDLLLGLLTPQSGNLYMDSTCITSEKKRAWQDMLGFVPQSIFLSEGTISENIAFGLPAKDIDLGKVTKALELANLTELVAQLPDGINTKVGERGIQLSGGQRQRIGIARALYHEAEVLVFDEATSALDGITERIVMDAIHEFSGKKTIVMIAHRLKTVEKCDVIYLMEEGRIVDHGTYEELLIGNTKFKEMAQYS